ncbi:protein of unknown function [Pararobbsia alpina]
MKSSSACLDGSRNTPGAIKSSKSRLCRLIDLLCSSAGLQWQIVLGGLSSSQRSLQTLAI